MASVTITGLENCKVIIDGEFEFVEDGWYRSTSGVPLPPNKSNYNILVVANEGFVFDNTLNAEISFRNSLNMPFGQQKNITTFNPTYAECWNESFTEFSIDVSLYDTVTSIEVLNFKAVEGSQSGGQDEVIGDSVVNLFSNIYNVEKSELLSLSDEIFAEVSSGGSTRIRHEEFISHLYVLPFSVEDLREDEKATIRMGGYETSVEAYLLTNSILVIDIAEITVPAKYNNAYDFINTECYLHLPYLKRVELDISRVVDKTITVQYIVDLYTGSAHCNVRSDDLLIMSMEFEISRTIPFYPQIDRTSIVGNVSKLIINNVEVPYIEVVRRIPYNEVGGLGNLISEVDTIGNFTGYIEVEKVHLETSASKREQELITSLLRNGVIIR